MKPALAIALILVLPAAAVLIVGYLLPATRDGTTRLTVREQARIASPLGRILARLVFDPEAFAAKYLAELDAEVTRRRTEGRRE
ncbi:MAG: hypothetical protein O2898_02340 [Proteobacteria bacterium]|nr:hypothetical protein [Pseudomonadota bacterium]